MIRPSRKRESTEYRKPVAHASGSDTDEILVRVEPHPLTRIYPTGPPSARRWACPVADQLGEWT